MIKKLLLIFAVLFILSCTDDKDPYITSPEPTPEVEPIDE